MSVLAGQGGRGLRDRVVRLGSFSFPPFARARVGLLTRQRAGWRQSIRVFLLASGAGRLLTASALYVLGPLVDRSKAIQEGRADLVGTQLARADDELAGRVGNGVAELHVIDRARNNSRIGGCGRGAGLRRTRASFGAP